MNRRRLLIYLTCLLYIMQLAVIAFSHVLSTEQTSLNYVVSVLLALVIGATDAAIIRYLLAALERAERAYSQDVSRKLEQSFELYRLEAAQEDRLAQEIGRSVEKELAQARAALSEQHVREINDHLRASLAITSQSHASYCDNVTVSAVLESKARQCTRSGVVLLARVSLPQGLPLPDVDVAALFFNLIDNALHECVELTKLAMPHVEPKIEVRSQIRAGQLFLEVENPSRKGGNARRISATRNARGRIKHGWGTQVVSSIVEQYGGIAEFKEGPDTFTASVMIPLPETPSLLKSHDLSMGR